MPKQTVLMAHAKHLGKALTNTKKQAKRAEKVHAKTPEKLALLVSLFLICLLITVASKPIAQAADYHHFVEQQIFMGLPHALNVLSTLPLLVVAFIGLFMAIQSDNKIGSLANAEAYGALFFTTAMVAVGSCIYHLWPSDHTLLWERLPMALSLMSLLSIMVGEFVANKLGRLTLYPALVIGALAVLYWYHTEIQGTSDLRGYLLIQMYPLLVMPIMLLLYSTAHKHQKAYWWLLGGLVVAKICLHYDQQIVNLQVAISGHTLKNLFSCLGVALFIKHL